MWDDSEWTPRGFQVRASDSLPKSRTEQVHTNTPLGSLGGFILVLAFAIAVGIAGAPLWFVAVVFLMAFVALAGGLAASEAQAREAHRAEEMERMAREELVEDISRSVKMKMESSIKVRCRYCGALNGENDEKCESCGAPL